MKTQTKNGRGCWIEEDLRLEEESGHGDMPRLSGFGLAKEGLENY